MPPETTPPPLQQQFGRGLDAPICLTWELTYACNLACVHCLSSSGRRDPAELTPAEARTSSTRLVDMRVFYVNIGGGEPMLRSDFFDLVSYAVERRVGVKFSTNGTRLTAKRRGSWPRSTTSTCRSALTARRHAPTTPSAVRARTRPPGRPWTISPEPGSAHSR